MVALRACSVWYTHVQKQKRDSSLTPSLYGRRKSQDNQEVRATTERVVALGNTGANTGHNHPSAQPDKNAKLKMMMLVLVESLPFELLVGISSHGWSWRTGKCRQFNERATRDLIGKFSLFVYALFRIRRLLGVDLLLGHYSDGRTPKEDITANQKVKLGCQASHLFLCSVDGSQVLCFNEPETFSNVAQLHLS
jgi:hypothetical protein